MGGAPCLASLQGPSFQTSILTQLLGATEGANVVQGHGLYASLTLPKVQNGCSNAGRTSDRLNLRNKNFNVVRSSHLRFPAQRQVEAPNNKSLSEIEQDRLDKPGQAEAQTLEQTDQSLPDEAPATDEVLVGQDADTSVPRTVQPILLFLALRTCCEILGPQFVAQLLRQPAADLDPSVKAISLLLFACVEYTGTYFVFASLKGTPASACAQLRIRRFQPQLVFGKEGWFLPALAGVGVLLLIPIASFLTLYTSGTDGPSGDSIWQLFKVTYSTANIASVVSSILVIISSPLLEEAVFRGFFQSSLQDLKVSSAGAVIVSSVVFSIAHLSSRSFVPLVLLGVVLGTVYDLSGNLCTPFVVHVAYNCVVTLLTTVLELQA